MPLYQFKLSSNARADMKDILAYSVRTHGKKTAKEYTALITKTFQQLSIDPFRPGSKDRSDIADNMRSFHISLTKEAVKSPIKNPRHIVFYMTLENDQLVINRLLHDARDHTRTMEDIRRDVIEKATHSKKRKPSRNRDRER